MRLLCLLIVVLILCAFGITATVSSLLAEKEYIPPEDKLLEQLTDALEQKDVREIKNLFSDNTVHSVQTLDEQITQLLGFYTGTMESIEDRGTHSSMSKQPEYRKETVNASYDVITTSGVYRIAFRFCTIDTTDEGNLGLQSLYITKEEYSDMDFSYWGGYQWERGIVIEETK